VASAVGLINASVDVLRRALSSPAPMNEPRAVENPHSSQYHDRLCGPMGRYHLAVRLKRRARKRFERMSSDEQKVFIARMKERGMDVSGLAAFAKGTVDPAVITTEAREQLVQFLERVGPQMAGRMGVLQSLTLLEDKIDSSRHVGRYLAAFASGAKMIWTIVHASDGTVTLDGTHAS
jgi:hypothetical protein